MNLNYVIRNLFRWLDGVRDFRRLKWNCRVELLYGTRFYILNRNGRFCCAKRRFLGLLHGIRLDILRHVVHRGHSRFRCHGDALGNG